MRTGSVTLGAMAFIKKTVNEQGNLSTRLLNHHLDRVLNNPNLTKQMNWLSEGLDLNKVNTYIENNKKFQKLWMDLNMSSRGKGYTEINLLGASLEQNGIKKYAQDRGKYINLEIPLPENGSPPTLLDCMM